MCFILCCCYFPCWVNSVLLSYKIQIKIWCLYELSVVGEYMQCQLKDDVITLSSVHTVSIVKIIYFSKIPPQKLLVSHFSLNNLNPLLFQIETKLAWKTDLCFVIPVFSVCLPAHPVRMSFLCKLVIFAKLNTLKQSWKILCIA